MRFGSDEFRTRLHGDFCVYCGQWSQSVEHFPPRSYGLRGYLLPACKECNSLAGTMWPLNFMRRVEYVREKLRKRYKKALRMPYWTIDERGEVGWMMRKGIDAALLDRRTAERRLAWSAVEYLRSIDPSRDFVREHADNGRTIDNANRWLELICS